MGLSIRAYAAQRGVSHTAVRKAVSSGRLTLEPDGSIDAAKADRSWVQNTDPSKTREPPKLKACSQRRHRCRARYAFRSRVHPSWAA